MIDPPDEIRTLVAFEGRGPGSDAERRAARHLEGRLEKLGREAEVEAAEIWPRWPLAYALHALLAIVGGVLSVSVPLAGGLIVLVAVVLTFLDAAGILLTTRRLLGRRASQNVVSREGGEKDGVLVLVAHMDAGRGGVAFSQGLTERIATLSQRVRRRVGPLDLLLWPMLAVLVCALLRVIGLEGELLTAIQFVPTVALIVVLALLVDTAISGVVPGANDNGSGVATVLRLAERYGGGLEHLSVWALFTGGGEAFGQGMRSFLRRHKKGLDQERTVFIGIDEVGAGTVRYTRREGAIATVRTHDQLLELCDDIAEDDADENAFAARRLVERGSGDGYVARARGFPAITVTCRNALDYAPRHHRPEDTPERIDGESLERAYGFCCELVERLDAQIGPDLAKPLEDTVLSEDSS